jgi:FtsH-binding integral membrane protein
MNLPIDTSTPVSDAPEAAGFVLLRNTYGLLAISLLPAVFGAWVGINLRVTEGITGATALIVLLLGGFGFSLLIRQVHHTRFALPVLWAFTFFTGLMLSLTLVRWLGFYTTGNTLMTAFAGAAALLFAAAATTRVLRRALPPVVETVLGVAVIALVIGAAELLLRSSTQVIVWSAVVGGALGAIVLHERRCLAQEERSLSAATATVGVFLGLFTAFRSLSPLVGRTGEERV